MLITYNLSKIFPLKNKIKYDCIIFKHFISATQVIEKDY